MVAFVVIAVWAVVAVGLCLLCWYVFGFVAVDVVFVVWWICGRILCFCECVCIWLLILGLVCWCDECCGLSVVFVILFS